MEGRLVDKRVVVNLLVQLSYVTEQSNQQLRNQLQSINSSINTNNLLTGINAYQTNKLRKGKKLVSSKRDFRL